MVEMLMPSNWAVTANFRIAPSAIVNKLKPMLISGPPLRDPYFLLGPLVLIMRAKDEGEAGDASSHALRDWASIRSTHIHVKVSRRHLTLTGHATDQAETAAALKDAASLSGIVEVTNRIEIR